MIISESTETKKSKKIKYLLWGKILKNAIHKKKTRGSNLFFTKSVGVECSAY